MAEYFFYLPVFGLIFLGLLNFRDVKVRSVDISIYKKTLSEDFKCVAIDEFKSVEISVQSISDENSKFILPRDTLDFSKLSISYLSRSIIQGISNDVLIKDEWNLLDKKLVLNYAQ